MRGGHDRYLPNTGEYKPDPEATGSSGAVLGGIKVTSDTNDGGREMGLTDDLAQERLFPNSHIGVDASLSQVANHPNTNERSARSIRRLPDTTFRLRNCRNFERS